LGFVLLADPNIMPLFSILKGLGFGLFFPSAVHIITERTPEKWASTAQSLMTVGLFGLAPLVAGPLGGYFLDAFSPSAVFEVGIWALGLAIGILWFASYRGEFV
jgi:MFS family permease